MTSSMHEFLCTKSLVKGYICTKSTFNFAVFVASQHSHLALAKLVTSLTTSDFSKFYYGGRSGGELIKQ